MSTADLARDRQITPSDDPDYPARDGKPMSDNTLQFTWIATLQGGIDALFADRDDVWVAGDCLWYPVEGQPKIRMAPDTMVVFGRPDGYRGSYIQHREAGVPVHVAFEVLSPGNRPAEMRRKLAFYQTYGVEEYYILDPDFGRHRGYLRTPAGVLEPIADLFGWTSPRLGIRFELATGKKPPLRLLRPDGRPLESYKDIARQRDDSERLLGVERERADIERERADIEQGRADIERGRADAHEQRADAERQRADAERQRAERLAAQLRALGMEPEA